MRPFDFALISTEPESIALELQPMTNDSAERLVGHRTRPPAHAPLLILDESFASLDPENLTPALRCVCNRALTFLGIAHP